MKINVTIYISDYRKLNENLIVNDLENSYIVIVFASLHRLTDTASFLGRYQFFSILFCHWLVVAVIVFTFYLASFEKISSNDVEKTVYKISKENYVNEH